ncbi:MAG: alpha-amylase [Lachnospiraceae bacterium]|nr:alpha-amylase [Lachnospiraceae bacterium]
MCKYKWNIITYVMICMLFTVSCGKTNTYNSVNTADTESIENSVQQNPEDIAKQAGIDITDTIPLNIIDDNYRTYYEVFVYSFYDSDGDGIGDIQGLISKLDYINDGNDETDTDLGCNGIWLMPVNPSPTYHKYDVADYYDIDSTYGTLEDFKELMEECDKRGIKVIMDLVLNHSSSQNPWFKEACDYLRQLGDGEPSVEDCPYFEYYNFSREMGSGCYLIEGTGWYYEAQFWSEMPDLNLSSEALKNEIEEIAKFWLDMGVGGFRLDAVKEYYSGNTQANIDFLNRFDEVVKLYKEDAYIVGEAWLDINEYAKYYESGIDSLFDFAFADKDGIIAKVLNGASASKYGVTIESLQNTFGQYNEDYIDAPFYTNHDMGRSAGYYSGENSENKTKLAGAMNLFMGGSAFLYYGEELGMKGSGKDENKRAPMYWSKSDDYTGMCEGPADMDDFEMKFDSLEEQENDPASIYNFYKKVIKIRNQNPEIARGKAQYLKIAENDGFSGNIISSGILSDNALNDTFCIIKKTYEGAEILIIFHLGESTEELDLSSVTINGSGILQDNIRGELLTGDDTISITDDILSMPPYSVIVLK